MSDTQLISLRVPVDLVAWLEGQAQLEGRTRTQMLVQLIMRAAKREVAR